MTRKNGYGFPEKRRLERENSDAREVHPDVMARPCDGSNVVVIGTECLSGAGTAGRDQVRKIAIRMRMRATVTVPTFTSVMKPS
jgi:hypothetical protein